jgi:hypothetical protein
MAARSGIAAISLQLKVGGQRRARRGRLSAVFDRRAEAAVPTRSSMNASLNAIKLVVRRNGSFLRIVAIALLRCYMRNSSVKAVNPSLGLSL